MSAAVTPELWRVAEQGSVGSLDVSGVRERTCPAERWLTLNGGARAAVPAAALPFLLPLAAVILSSVPRGGAPGSGVAGSARSAVIVETRLTTGVEVE